MRVGALCLVCLHPLTPWGTQTGACTLDYGSLMSPLSPPRAGKFKENSWNLSLNVYNFSGFLFIRLVIECVNPSLPSILWAATARKNAWLATIKCALSPTRRRMTRPHQPGEPAGLINLAGLNWVWQDVDGFMWSLIGFAMILSCFGWFLFGLRWVSMYFGWVWFDLGQILTDFVWMLMDIDWIFAYVWRILQVLDKCRWTLAGMCWMIYGSRCVDVDGFWPDFDGLWLGCCGFREGFDGAWWISVK